ncbi:hypothetical protein D3C85_479870 [compost metagenome]
MGKFHGAMMPMTPTGWRSTSTSIPARMESRCSPWMRSDSPAKNLKICPARTTSPIPSARVLPSSRASRVPSSWRRRRISLPMKSSASARCCGLFAAHSGCADSAAVMAVWVSSADAWAYRPTRSVVSEGLRFSRTPMPSSHCPAIRFLCISSYIPACSRGPQNAGRAEVDYQRTRCSAIRSAIDCIHSARVWKPGRRRHMASVVARMSAPLMSRLRGSRHGWLV